MPYDFGPRDAANFPARCAALAAKHAPLGADGLRGRALDIGCAVGGASFELARSFSHVTGIDFSHAFVAAAKRLQSGERLPCTAVEEGTLSSWFVAAAPDGVDSGRVVFRQGDACALPPPSADFGPFSAVLASNLLCRLPDPDAFLASLARARTRRAPARSHSSRSRGCSFRAAWPWSSRPTPGCRSTRRRSAGWAGWCAAARRCTARPPSWRAWRRWGWSWWSRATCPSSSASTRASSSGAAATPPCGARERDAVLFTFTYESQASLTPATSRREQSLTLPATTSSPKLYSPSS